MAGEIKTAKWPVKVLVLFHIVAITLWSLPKPPNAVRDGRIVGSPVDSFLKFTDERFCDTPLRFYLTSTGLWQYWDMFAPDPLKLDYYLEAEILYQDGVIETVPFPRMAEMTIPARYAKERFRKFVERAHSPDYMTLWDPTAQWMAAQHFTDPKYPPQSVNLRLRSREIPPPTPDLPEDRPFNIDFFHSQAIDQDRLFRARGWARP